MTEDEIQIESGVSAFTGAGFVVLRWGEESGQLTPAEARQHGLHVIQCAMAAEDDALVMAELADAGVDADVRAGFLAAMRRRRDA